MSRRVVNSSKAGFLLAMDVSCWSFIRMAKLAEPQMVDGGTLSTMTYYGAQMVVEHYNMMGARQSSVRSWATRYLAAELGPRASECTPFRPDRSRPGPRRGSRISTSS